MQYIDQMNDFDCGVACLGMVSGLSQSEIEDRLGYRCSDTRVPTLPFGVLVEEMVLILHALERQPLLLRTKEGIEDEARHFNPDSIHAAVVRTMDKRRQLPDHEGVIDLALDHQAILNVRSIVHEHQHAVAWNGWRVLDPHPFRTVECEGLDNWRIMSAVILMK